jgi:hypothetical protein
VQVQLLKTTSEFSDEPLGEFIQASGRVPYSTALRAALPQQWAGPMRLGDARRYKSIESIVAFLNVSGDAGHIDRQYAEALGDYRRVRTTATTTRTRTRLHLRGQLCCLWDSPTKYRRPSIISRMCRLCIAMWSFR